MLLTKSVVCAFHDVQKLDLEAVLKFFFLERLFVGVVSFPCFFKTSWVGAAGQHGQESRSVDYFFAGLE